MIAKASAGGWDGIHIGFPCSTGALSRLFDASDADGGDMVESFELEVPFVRTADNVADILTKPMRNANDFHRLRRIIMNETT